MLDCMINRTSGIFCVFIVHLGGGSCLDDEKSESSVLYSIVFGILGLKFCVCTLNT